MKTATPVKAITILEAQTLPNGVKVLLVPCKSYKALEKLPDALQYDNQVYGCTGWNSDSKVAYYRTDKAVAFPVA